jgi:hypothetical protein
VVEVTQSISIVTLSHNPRLVPLSAVKGVGLDATLYANVAFVLIKVVHHLFKSIVVVQDVEATVQTCKSAHNTLIGYGA